MSWSVIARAASVYAKDKAADYTEDTRFESDFDQWDNPAWYDYLAAAASGYSGKGAKYVKAGANLAKGIGSYQDTGDYRDAVGAAMSAYGNLGGAGSSSKVFNWGKKGIGYLPDTRDIEDANDAGTVGMDPNDPTNDYPGHYYRPDVMSDLYNNKFESQYRGNVMRGPNDWQNDPRLSPPGMEGMDDENLAQGQLAGSMGGYEGMDLGSVSGGLTDVILGRGYNTRPEDPYWREVEGGDTNYEGGSVKEGWFDKMFG